MRRKIGTAGLILIKQFEGCRLTAYKPVSTEKYWTIGWGHYGADVKKGQKITQDEADKLLIEDLEKFEGYVNDIVPFAMNQNQFDALVSFCYNCGAGNLRTLVKGRTAAQVAEKITSYNKAGGKVLNGLVRRRAAERELFMKKPTPEVRTTCALKCREKASATSEVLGIFAKGAVLQVLVKGKKWNKVRGITKAGKAITGYCNVDYLVSCDA